MVALLSGNTLSFVRDYPDEPDVEFIPDRFMDGVDIVLAEGFKWTGIPKVWVFRSENADSIIRKDESLAAVVSDRDVDLGVPWFDIDDVPAVADFIEKRFLKPA